MFQRIGLSSHKASALFLGSNREPVLEQPYATVDQHALQVRALAHKFEVLSPVAEFHYSFYAGAVVPGAIKQHDLAGGRQLLNIPLEVPLATFSFGRFIERNNPCAAWIEMFHKTLDGAALTSRITTFKQDDNPLTGLV